MIELRDLALPDGRKIPVDTRIYPMLMEWDWRFDPKRQMVVRQDGMTLYHEQLRLSKDAEMLPTLDGGAIRALFGHYPVWREYVSLSARQREFALWTLNVNTPNHQELISEGLTVALTAFFRWRAGGEAFVADSSLPGPMKAEAIVPDEVPATLRDFLEHELTGRWVADSRAPAGVAPETHRDVVRTILIRRWNDLYRGANWEHPSLPKAKAVRQALKAEDLPVWLLIEHALGVIGKYPL